MRPIVTQWTPGAGSRMAFVVLAMAPLLMSCGGTGRATDCAWARPIYIGGADQLTDGTARQILAHNQTGGELCGWR